MSRKKKCLALCLVASLVKFICADFHPHGIHDWSHHFDKEKMKKMAIELIMDAYLKMRQITEIRVQHEEYVSFNVGILIGRIREKYRHMEEVYIDIHSKHTVRTGKLFGAGLREIRTLHYVNALQIITHMQRDIEQIVHTLEITLKDEMMDGNWWKQKKIGQSKGGRQKKKSLRMGEYSEDYEEDDDVSDEAWMKVYKEEQEKSRLRQKYLIKKLGMPANATTTKKRFLSNWPVEDTWNLENLY